MEKETFKLPKLLHSPLHRNQRWPLESFQYALRFFFKKRKKEKAIGHKGIEQEKRTVTKIIDDSNLERDTRKESDAGSNER